jgi:endoglucanase
MRYTIIILLLTFILRPCFAQQTAVEKFGALQVTGNKIVDKNRMPVQLRGMSLFWSQWQGQYYNPSTVKWLVEDWKINIIRVAMAVDNKGYATNPREKTKVIAVIDAAIKNGIYVLVDFHVHDASKYIEHAKTFFAEIAEIYGHYPNIIYEPWNEPVHDSWNDVIKPYHEAVIAEIRKHDPDNLIVCGTRTWSQDVDEASTNPIEGVNIAYTLHFYAATHKQQLREKAKVALENGIALMVTEYGTCEATGDGIVDEAETRLWWDFLDEHKISHANWAMSDKVEAASAVVPGTRPSGRWKKDQLTRSGTLVRNEIASKN